MSVNLILEIGMKKTLFSILLILAFAIGLVAQPTVAPVAPATGYFGVYLADLDEDTAEELGYPYMFGVLVSGVVEDSPADDYGIEEDDIIMSVNGAQANDRATFMQLVGNVMANQSVNFSIWRAEAPIEIAVVAGTRPTMAQDVQITPTRKQGVGFGGGSWIPAFQFHDPTDVNAIIVPLGFKALPEDGVFMQGGAGKGNVGKGIFIGGMGMSYTVERKKAETDPALAGFHTNMRYTMSMGGVTLDKRFPIFKNVVGSIGTMLGAGEHSLELARTNGSYNWGDINGTMLNSANSYVRLNRDFLVVQPRAELYWKLLPWFALRGEVAYTYGYAPEEGWTAETGTNEEFEVTGSPNTDFGGLSISIGPWFGF